VETTSRPFSKPTASPPASPRAIELTRPLPATCARTVIIPPNPTTAETDMSKLQVISKAVWPSEMMPRIETADMMLSRFRGIKNTSENTPPMITKKISRRSAVLSRRRRTTGSDLPLTRRAKGVGKGKCKTLFALLILSVEATVIFPSSRKINHQAFPSPD
jgi:hypothetical protein